MDKVILIFGILSSIANAIIFSDIEPAMWGWMSSAMWATGLFVREALSNK